ncbi:MAG: excinuclease ABC subunit UvrC [Gemmatimonadota bacterium]|nr:excinuclease ABC subunit UvrC [Gemmatimonadota bacterium]
MKHLPTSPGVYLMKDAKGVILYVGKAKSLRSRVRSYFTINRYSQPKTTALMNRIKDVDFIATDSEMEALILEDNLVKKHKPKYNVRLRDDKSFPFIKVTNELFPRLIITRDRKNDGARYFGPYTNVRAMRRTLETVRKVFPTRTCDSPRTWSSMDRPCLEFDIKRCTGPCKGHISEADYGDIINQVCEFLSGKKNGVLRSLSRKMKEASKGMEYELAASIRDQIKTIGRDAVRQRVRSKGSAEQDVFAVVDEGETACISVLTIREGKMVDKNHFFVTSPKENSKTELLEAFLARYYLAFSDQHSLPEEIVVPVYSEDMEPLNVWLSESKGKKVVFTTPQRGHKVSLLGLAERNAKLQLDTRILRNAEMHDRRAIPPSVEALQECLRLPNPPRRIETFDVSNIQGAVPVASMVCFVGGKPKKAEYRKYDIKDVIGPNDFAMMREVVGRRYRRIIDEDGPLPDLVVIDGGKGQLSSAKRVLNELGLVDVPVIGLAKRLEEVFFPERSAPVMIPKTSPALKLLMQARDEAHRFAVTFHRSKRSRSMIRSVLDEIPGIGAKRRQNLLRAMGSVEKISLSSVEELAQVKGIGTSAAKIIYDYLHPDG